VGSSTWFSQALAINDWSAAAFGQVDLVNSGAYLNWMLPVSHDKGDPLPALLDNLCMEAGLRGSRFMTASCILDDSVFHLLRSAGFCPFSWQRFWCLTKPPVSDGDPADVTWQPPSDQQVAAISSLQRRLLSPAVRAVVKSAADKLPDWVMIYAGEIQGFSAVREFNRQVILTPFITQTCEAPAAILAALVHVCCPDASSVYIRQTGDSAWLIDHLEKIANAVTPREELLVKHFTLREKAHALEEVNHAVKNRHTDPVAPFIRSSNKRNHL